MEGGGGEAPASSPVARAGTFSPLREKRKGRPKNDGIAAAEAFRDDGNEEEEALALEALVPLAEVPKRRPEDPVDAETVR